MLMIMMSSQSRAMAVSSSPSSLSLPRRRRRRLPALFLAPRQRRRSSGCALASASSSSSSSSSSGLNTSSSSSFGGIHNATSEDVALYIHKIANLHKLSFKKIQTMAWRYGVNVASKSERDARIMVAREMIRRHLPPGAVLPDAILDPSLPPANPIVTNPEELHVVGTAQCVTDVIEQMYNLNESAVLLISYKLKSCMACKAMTPKLNKVVKELHESTEGAVKLLHVDCTARTWPALEPFSVRAFPFFQTADAISGLHEGFTANLNSIGKVREAVLREVSAKVGTCELACEFPRPESMPVVLGSMDELDI